MSGWGSKLQTKLSALSETSSKETCQTLAKWIGFNRKQIEDFCPLLLDALKTSKQVVVLNVIYELLLLDRDNSKWDRLADLRQRVGEEVLLPSCDSLTTTSRDKVLLSLNDWEDASVFSERPTLSEQLRRKLKQTGSESLPKAVTAAAAVEPVKAVETGTATAKVASKPPAEPAAPSKPAASDVASKQSEPKTNGSTTTATTTTTGSEPQRTDSPFDFESRGIPAATIDPQALIPPSQQISQYQIGRDLRNDSAVQLMSLFTNLPEDVRILCADAAATVEAAEQAGDTTITNKEFPIEEAKARDFSIRIPSQLIDTDFNEQLQDVQHFRDLVLKQTRERLELLRMLIASRCAFGSQEAAAAFTNADRAMGELVKRKQILLDAMELEGVDMEEVSGKDNIKLEELPPLTWYNPDGAPEAKRQRTEE